MSPDSAPSKPTATGSYCHLPMPSDLHKMGLLGFSTFLNEFLDSTQKATVAFGLGQHWVTASGGDLGVPGCAPCVGCSLLRLAPQQLEIHRQYPSPIPGSRDEQGPGLSLLLSASQAAAPSHTWSVIHEHLLLSFLLLCHHYFCAYLIDVKGRLGIFLFLLFTISSKRKRLILSV